MVSSKLGILNSIVTCYVFANLVVTKVKSDFTGRVPIGEYCDAIYDFWNLYSPDCLQFSLQLVQLIVHLTSSYILVTTNQICGNKKVLQSDWIWTQITDFLAVNDLFQNF